VSGDLWPCDRLLGVQAVPTIAVPARTARRRPKRLRVYQSTPGRSLSEGLHSTFAPAQYFKARRHCPTPTPEEAIERFVGIVDVEVGLCMAEILDKQLQRVTSLQVFCFGVADRLPRFTGGPGAAFEARVGAGEPNCHVSNRDARPRFADYKGNDNLAPFRIGCADHARLHNARCVRSASSTSRG
jgi:hypothetical protein